MPRTLLHEISNLLGIASGKARQVSKMLQGSLNGTDIDIARERLQAAIAAIDRMTELIKIEKNNSEITTN